MDDRRTRPSRKFRRLFSDYLSCFWADLEKVDDGSGAWIDTEENLAKAQARLFAYVTELEAATGEKE